MPGRMGNARRRAGSKWALGMVNLANGVVLLTKPILGILASGLMPNIGR